MSILPSNNFLDVLILTDYEIGRLLADRYIVDQITPHYLKKIRRHSQTYQRTVYPHYPRIHPPW